MQVLKILSDIWKSGADMKLDSDGQIELKNHQLVPAETMKVAEGIFPKIEKWFQSWKNESSENITLMKMVHQMCGWQQNDKLNEWLCAEDDSLELFNDWMIMLAQNGWIDIYSDFRLYANDESIKMGKELYKRAVMYAKKGA
ncbi:hypothetical protein [Psychrobacillus sp. FSL H8-0487]|uniref:hypothetical protein n=1 Tax=Psychrobacillus sp. FSL H8-0487 TaxID=2921391 RepID=UPI0030F9C240